MTGWNVDDDLTPVRRVPEKSLWASVLIQAFKDLEGLQFGNAGSVAHNRANAISWVRSNRTDYVGSFMYVCEALDLNPEIVRGAFRKGKRSKKQLTIRRCGITEKVRNTDPTKFLNMTILEIAAHFGTNKANAYNMMSKLGLKFKHLHRGGNHRTKKLLT